MTAAALAAFTLWLAAVGPVRTWASGAGVRDAWLVGVAPSLFAGLTMALWLRRSAGAGPLYACALSAGLTALAEIAHVWMPRQTADPGDVLAGLAGAALAWPLLRWHAGAGSADGGAA